MPSFNPQQLQNRARNANSVTIMIGDVVVAFAQTTNHSIDFGTQGLYGVGSAKPQEIQQMRVSQQITVDSFALTQAGIDQLGYTSNLSSLLAANEFDLHVVDGNTGDPLYTYVGSVAQNFSENISANQPISDSITFLALDVLDASGQSILDVGNAYEIPSGTATTGPNGLGIAA